METYKEVEARMPVDKDGSYKRRPGDWENREGCVRPMISLTHTKVLGSRKLGPFFMVDVSEAKTQPIDSLCMVALHG